MIQAYPDRLSVAPGETLSLHVATDHPEFRVAIYRQGVELALQLDYGWQPIRTIGISPGPPDAAWEWDAYDFPIPSDAPSGAYIAMLWERDGAEVVEPDRKRRERFSTHYASRDEWISFPDASVLLGIRAV